MYEESKMGNCTECKVPVIRLYEVRGISFRGDGFYSNDRKTTIEFNG
jgi:predicted nucleic acid-binding Zn ribbon protein